MSVLGKIRENVGLVIILIAVSLGAFIFVDFFKGGPTGPETDIGEVFGQVIPEQRLAEQVELYEQRADPDMSEDERFNLRQQAWNDVVNQVIFQKEYDALGLSVSDEELSQLYFGPITHRFVVQSNYFKNDTTGQFDPNIVRQALQLADQINLDDPSVAENYKQFKKDMISLREAIISDRLQQKYFKLLQSGMLVSDNEVRRKYTDDSKSLDLSYVYVPFSSVPDNEITVTDEDFRKYYEKNKENFTREEEVIVKYAYFPIQPSRDDSSAVRESLVRLKADFARTKDPMIFASSNSDGAVDTTFKAIATLPLPVIPLAERGRTDSVVGPLLSEGKMKVYRMIEKKEDTIFYHRLRHILLRPEANTAEDSAKTKAKAQDLRNQASPENFAQLVQENSVDFATQNTGGDLGWVEYNARGPEFEEAIQKANKGEYVVAESPEGMHVVEISDKSKTLYRVAEISRDIIASTASTDSIYKRASQYAGEVATNGNLDSARKDFPECDVLTSQPLGLGGSQLLGLQGARSVVSWAFSNETGAKSEEVLETGNAFVIAEVLAKNEKGYRTLDEVKEQIRTVVTSEVKARTIKEKLKGGNDLASIASTYGEDAQQGTFPGATFSNITIPNIGSEPYIVGRAFGMDSLQVSPPLRGRLGVYRIRVDKVNQSVPLNDAMIPIQRQSIASQKQQAIINTGYQALRELAEIKDYRYKFQNY